MRRIRSVGRYFRGSATLKTGAQLVKTVSAIVREIGFETFVYGSFVPNDANDPDIVVITTLPYEWVARYDRMSYIEVDPRVQNCLHHVTPFLWDSTRSYGQKADAFLKDAARYGLEVLPYDGKMIDDCRTYA